MRAGVTAAALAIALTACEPPLPVRAIPLGFTRASARPQLALERRFLGLPDPGRLRETHRELTRAPHPAGSPRDRELTDWTARVFREAGMEDVRITAHDVLLPQPAEVVVEMTHPHQWRAPLHEDPVADPDTHVDRTLIGPPHHAYSASGEVRAPLVYAGFGDPRDYEWLAGRGIDVRGKIVLVRYSRPYSYRGYKAFVAEQRGAAGILMYSDPAEDGRARGAAYPQGPWAPDTRIERGGIVYDFLVPGDPLTPGWASLPGARRISRTETVSLPRILSAPLSAQDAAVILGALDGPPAPDTWRGALPLTYRVGGGTTRVRMKIRMDDRVRPVWSVTGMFRGAEFPDHLVIVGNHRDAWIYGGVDPSSGSAALLELAHAFGSLAREGWRPRRSILFASWDAEEFALTSSTEWGEQHEAWLRDRAVAYLNVDAAASGSRFVAAAVPSLARFLTQVAEAVNDPGSGIPVAAVARDRARAAGDPKAEGDGDALIDDRIGGGSDYTVFLNFLGIPVADLAFEGPYGVYHSLYDTHEYVARFADPAFRYHAAIVRIWGLAALRLAHADALPLEPAATASRIKALVADARRRVPEHNRKGAASLDELMAAAGRLDEAASAFGRAREQAIEAGDRAALNASNARLMGFERAFLDEEGLPGRPWYRHLIFAPRYTYEPQMLPGLNDAIGSGDLSRVVREAGRLAAALRRAAARLEGG